MFRPQDGDMVVVIYQPQKGATPSVNQRTSATCGGHRPIVAMRAACADDAPLEKALVATIPRNYCA